MIKTVVSGCYGVENPQENWRCARCVKQNLDAVSQNWVLEISK